MLSSFPFDGNYAHPPPKLPIRIASGWSLNTNWTGDLSDLQVFSKPLSESEINAIFDGAVNVSAESGIIGRWKLDEGIGTILYDHTENALNGTVHNPSWR